MEKKTVRSGAPFLFAGCGVMAVALTMGIGSLVSYPVALAVGAAVFAFAPALTARFAHDAQTADVAGSALRLQSAVFFAQSAVILMTMLTQSLGQTVRAALVATSRQGLFLLPLLTLLPRVFGLWGLLACQSVSDVISLVFSWLLTRKVFPLSPFTRSSSPCGGDNRPQTAEG